MHFATIFQRQGRSLIFFEALMLVFAIGGIDFYTGYQVTVSIFYSVPIYIVGWHVDKESGLLIALIAGIVWWWMSVLGGLPYLNNWQEAWETIVRISFFLFIAIGAASLKRERDAAAARIALLEHSRRLESEIIEISEREQQRIGRDLHDGLCQHQAGLACAATALKGDLLKKGLPEEAKLAGDLAALLQQAVGQTRDLARGLVPVQMEEMGLASALEELARSVSQMFSVRCCFEVRGNPTNFDNAAATHLYRIAQEAINNATRHGAAENIELTLMEERGVNTLSIADDGVGLTNTSPSGSGMGLNIMTYRANVAGGRLSIHEPATGGTIVCCIIPAATDSLHELAA
jgi:signal transduction histidine kinase